jgi:hypothetical protein
MPGCGLLDAGFLLRKAQGARQTAKKNEVIFVIK